MLRLGKFRELSFIGSADIIGNAIGAIFWLFISSQITPEEYGELSYFIGIVTIASAVALIGSQHTITVYSSKNIRIQSTMYFLSLIFGVVASIVIMILFYKIDAVLLLFGFIINVLAIGELLGKKSFSLYSKHMILQKVLSIILGIGFLYIFGPEGILFALALSYIFFTIIIYKGFREYKIDFSLLKNKSKFIINNYVIDILIKLNAHLNKFIIVPLLGFGILGNFTLSLQIASLGMIFTMIVFKYTMPYDAQGHENKKLKNITYIVSVGLAFLGVFVAPMIIPIFFPQYIEAIDAIKIVSISIVPMTISRMYSSKLLGQENNIPIALASVVAMIIFIIGILISSSFYGITGLAISYLLSKIGEALYLVITTHSHKNKTMNNV